MEDKLDIPQVNCKVGTFFVERQGEEVTKTLPYCEGESLVLSQSAVNQPQ
jgi:hypothetical protein